jgi:hypothetical protein
MAILILFGLGCLALFGGFLTYTAWRQPERHARYHMWFARLHAKWNPAQEEWMMSPAYVLTMKVADTCFFILSLLVFLIRHYR